MATSGLLNELRNRCLVSAAWDPRSGTPKPQAVEFDALWDTGATNSVISQEVIDKCGLKPTGMTEVRAVNKVSRSETYLTNIILPNTVTCVGVRVAKGKIPGSDVLIGMDIISRGDFSVTNCDGHSQFSYRTPSIEHIDYVAQAKAIIQAQQAQPKPQTRAERRRAKLGRS